MSSKLFIGGAWCSPRAGKAFDVVNPANEEVIASVALAEAPDIDAAVAAARRAFDEGPWPRLPGGERAVVLRRISRLIRERRAFLAEMEVRNNGKPLAEALWDIDDTAACFAFYADMAETACREETVALADERFTSRAVREPVGVVAAIIPWNYPMLMASWKRDA